jgi:hypothetical protein
MYFTKVAKFFHYYYYHYYTYISILQLALSFATKVKS